MARKVENDSILTILTLMRYWSQAILYLGFCLIFINWINENYIRLGMPEETALIMILSTLIFPLLFFSERLLRRILEKKAGGRKKVSKTFGWERSCKYAPDKEISLHCKKTNTGKRYEKNEKRKESGVIGKGYYRCARKCRFYEPKARGKNKNG